jgi:hypothetical protein
MFRNIAKSIFLATLIALPTGRSERLSLGDAATTVARVP